MAYRVNATAHLHDAEAVHDLRVAVRRFGQSLVVFKRVFLGRELKKIRRRLKELMELTNGVRDCDVATGLLAKSELPGALDLLEKLRERRKDALELLLPALRRWAARRTTGKWRAALTPNGTAHQPLEDTARDRLPRIARKFLKNGGRASSAAELHRARIEGKKLRYSLELFQPLYGAQIADTLEHLKDVQSLLGDVNDCHTVRLLVEDLGGDAEIEAWLKKRQQKKIREFRDGWAKSVDALRESIRALKRPPRKPMARSAGRTAPARTA